MRLWTLHPKYLDPQGLVALWREALLAQAVLRGRMEPEAFRRWFFRGLVALGVYMVVRTLAG